MVKVEFLTLDYKKCPEGEKPARFGFECPRNPGQMCSGLLIDDADVRHGQGVHMWKWNGDREKPTFTPSINCLSEFEGKPAAGCGFHGYITDGEIKGC